LHTTQNGATTDPNATGDVVKVQDYHPPALGAPQSRLDALLRRSERLVRGASSPPEDSASLAAYRDAARDAELAAFEFLLERPSYLKRESVLDSSTDFVDSTALESILRGALGEWYVSPRARSEKNVAVLADWPY
jgi:hypothetical protein